MDFEKFPVAEQSAMNMLLNDGKHDHIRWGTFPTKIWARSHGDIPRAGILLHHANCATNTAEKLEQMQWVRELVTARPGSRSWRHLHYLRARKKARWAYFESRKTLKNLLKPGANNGI